MANGHFNSPSNGWKPIPTTRTATISSARRLGSWPRTRRRSTVAFSRRSSSRRRAYKESSRALEIDPRRHDAGLIVGVYQYIVSLRSFPMRWVARIAGMDGNKARAVELIEAAARYPGANQTDARLMLALIYNRDQRYDEALAILTDLQSRYPDNRLLWLEAGATALRAGRFQKAKQSLDEGFPKLSTAPLKAFGEEALWRYKRGASLVGLHQAAAADIGAQRRSPRKRAVVDSRPFAHRARQACRSHRRSRSRVPGISAARCSSERPPTTRLASPTRNISWGALRKAPWHRAPRAVTRPSRRHHAKNALRCRAMKTVQVARAIALAAWTSASSAGQAASAAAEIGAALRVRLRASRGRRRQPVPVEARGNGNDRHVGRLLSCRPPEGHAHLGCGSGSRCGHQAGAGAMRYRIVLPNGAERFVTTERTLKSQLAAAGYAPRRHHLPGALPLSLRPHGERQ